MFHVFSIENSRFDVPLEKLQHREEFKRIEKAHPPRKVVTELSKEDPIKAGIREINYSLKGYRKAIQVDDERVQLLHAFQIMSSPVMTFTHDMTVADGWRFMVKSGVCHFPVLGPNHLIIGIVSERDLLKRLMIMDDTVQKSTDQTIAEIMTREVICASRETDIRRIARAMFESHIDSMPIVDKKKELNGIVTRSDILFALIHYGAMKMWA